MRPKERYYSRDEKVLDLMWPAVWQIFTVKQLKIYLLAFPYPEAAQPLLEGITFLTERFVQEDGKAPDYRKIWERRRIMKGRRLHEDALIDMRFCAAINSWLDRYIETYGPPGKGKSWQSKKKYGASSPLDLAYDIMTMIMDCTFHSYPLTSRPLPDDLR